MILMDKFSLLQAIWLLFKVFYGPIIFPGVVEKNLVLQIKFPQIKLQTFCKFGMFSRLLGFNTKDMETNG